MRTRILLLLALLSAPAWAAQSVVVSWDAPTQFSDNKAITAGTSITYTLYLVGATGWTAIDKGITTLTITHAGALPSGQQCFAVTATANGFESARSTPSVCVVLGAAPVTVPPKPPGNVTIQVH